MKALPLLLTALCLVAGQAGCASKRPLVDPAATHPIPPWTVPPAADGVTYVRCHVIGDWGTARQDQKDVARAMALRAEREPIDFVLTTGDNFYSAGVQSVSDPLWQTTFERIYAAPSLQVPFYAALGNHDHGGDPQAQVDYTRTSDRWRMPDRQYSFRFPLDDGAAVDLFVIDTTPIHEDGGDDQVAWLRAKLAGSDARWKLVVGHHPLYSHSSRDYNSRLIEALEAVFVEHGVDLYLAGHDHILEMLEPVRGVNYVVSGAAGGKDKAYRARWTDRSRYVATLGGFVALRISREELVIEFVRLKGETQYAHVLTKS